VPARRSSKAIALDEREAAAHAWLGIVLTEYGWDWTGAERAFQRALELNPNFAHANKLYAESLSYVGRFDEKAERQTQKQSEGSGRPHWIRPSRGRAGGLDKLARR
jgi:lipoprotein NlpI